MMVLQDASVLNCVIEAQLVAEPLIYNESLKIGKKPAKSRSNIYQLSRILNPQWPLLGAKRNSEPIKDLFMNPFSIPNPAYKKTAQQSVPVAAASDT